MGSFRHFSRTFILLALALGLNACGLAFLHGHHAAHMSRVNYGHVPLHGQHHPHGRRSRSRVSHADTHANLHADRKVAPKAKPDFPAIADLAQRPELEFVTVESPLTRIHVLAFQSAPRGPDSARGPPTA